MRYVYILDIRVAAIDIWGFSRNRSTEGLIFSSKKKALTHLQDLYSDVVNDPEIKDGQATVSDLTCVDNSKGTRDYEWLATDKRHNYEFSIKFSDGARNDCYATITKQEVH